MGSGARVGVRARVAASGCSECHGRVGCSGEVRISAAGAAQGHCGLLPDPMPSPSSSTEASDGSGFEANREPSAAHALAQEGRGLRAADVPIDVRNLRAIIKAGLAVGTRAASMDTSGQDPIEDEGPRVAALTMLYTATQMPGAGDGLRVAGSDMQAASVQMPSHGPQAASEQGSGDPTDHAALGREGSCTPPPPLRKASRGPAAAAGLGSRLGPSAPGAARILRSAQALYAAELPSRPMSVAGAGPQGIGFLPGPGSKEPTRAPVHAPEPVSGRGRGDTAEGAAPGFAPPEAQGGTPQAGGLGVPLRWWQLEAGAQKIGAVLATHVAQVSLGGSWGLTVSLSQR